MNLPSCSPVPVVCLVLRDPTGAVLVTQRPAGKRLALLWEFPGGKVEPGESTDEALRREIHEELGIAVGTLTPLPATTHHYDYGTICLQPFVAYCAVRPALQLNEHVAAQWITPCDWPRLQWAPADIPVLERLCREGGELKSAE